jgi:hypothetical protein
MPILRAGAFEASFRIIERLPNALFGHHGITPDQGVI